MLPSPVDNRQSAALRELREQHSEVLERYPSANFLVPHPTGPIVSNAYIRTQITRADMILRALRNPRPQHLHETVVVLFDGIFSREPSLLDLLPEPPSPEINEIGWIELFLERLHVVSSVAELYRVLDIRSSAGQVLSADLRARKRMQVLENTMQIFQNVIELHPAAAALLPDPRDGALSKIAWERQMHIARASLRILADNDRVEGHNFLLDTYQRVLRRVPHLRELLPDPAEDSVDDNHWSREFMRAARILSRA